MPQSLQAFIWVLGIAVIGVLFAIVGFLLKDKLNAILLQMQGLRNDLRRLFEKEEKNAIAITEIKGDIKTINERCKTIKCVQENS